MIFSKIYKSYLTRISDFFIFLKEYKNWREILAAKIWHKESMRDIIIQLRNYNFCFKTHIYGGIIITFFRDIFIRDVYHLKEFSLKQNSIILDIGSNIGMFVLFVKTFYRDSKIIAYEPEKENFNLLKENIMLNNIDNCICHNKAVWKKSGQTRFIIGDNIAVGHIDYQNSSGTKGIMVECLSLEDVFKIDNIRHCDLLKLDCEGAEYDILFNSENKIFDKISNITIEVHEIDKYRSPEKMKFFLINKGYKVNLTKNYLIAKKY